ncbi:transcription cofactor vestigial-like protein 3 isoform X4 [Pimephales promelas]|uniref:transcription cofactor vestigial-like protein 3 isoform X4 n=1 Tax=Pimephales promelas TaxID=90988 RepID=UPI001955E095|nr:transcription cofactor vestigial-like protein 3 isoform X4 [Pimephales promelas]
MSCLDVMYHQSYGAHHYLPATSSAAAAAAAYKAAYYHHHQHHHHQQQQQQKKFGAYSRMDSEEFPSHCGQNKQPGALKPRPEPELPREEEQNAGEEERCKEAQPAEAEYLSARCVVFTYFRGDIGDVVDEHFSRALSQPSSFSNDAKTGRLHSGGPWKEGNSHSEGQCGSVSSSLWASGYPSQTSPCVSSSHPDFPHSAAFHPADTGIWSSHSLAPPSALTDSWHYGLGAQSGAGYPHVHEMYPHMHPRHPHPHRVLHHAHSPVLDPRFSPLLLPSVRASCSPTSYTDAIKTELEPSSIPAPNWPVSFHGSVDIYDTAPEQDKAKASAWF